MGDQLNAGDIGTITELPVGASIAAAVSGGLDSVTYTHWLTQRGYRVIGLIGDLGQPDEVHINDAVKRMKAAGAAEVHALSLHTQLAEAGLLAVQANARWDGGYFQSTGVARHVVCQGIAHQMRELGLTVLAHGSTGRGNDQYRFDSVLHNLSPGVRLYAPWRDPLFLAEFQGREQMIAYCGAHGVPVRATVDRPYSTDTNFLGATHEAGELEQLSCSPFIVEPVMTQWPHLLTGEAAKKPESVKVRWQAGRPVEVNGKPLSLVEVFQALNAAGKRNGIGLVTQVENRINGLKGRGVYEQPGTEILAQLYQAVLQLVLDQSGRDLYQYISRTVAIAIYTGSWFNLTATMCHGGLRPLAALIDGEVEAALFMGNVTVRSVKGVKASLYDAANVSMEAVGTFNHADSTGALRIRALGDRQRAYAGHVDPNRFNPEGTA